MGKKRIEIDVQLNSTYAGFEPSEFDLPNAENFTADDVIVDMQSGSKYTVIQDLDLIDASGAIIHVTVIDEETGEVTRGSW